jgi:ribosomal protein S18 acetylase RimI-like enzyme
VLVANTRAVMLYRELGFREVMRHGENSLKIRMQLEFE